VYLAGQKQTAIVKETLDAPVAPQASERPPVNLTIVLDRSGSMSGDKIARARDAAIAALRLLGPRELFSLVTYDHEVNTVVPAQSAANAEWIEARIRSIQSGGNTALFAGVSQGASEIRKNIDGEYIHRILLLSDGRANKGPSSPADLGRLGTALRKEGISVSTIGVGTDYNEDLMTQMAQNSDGNTYFVESSADLPRIFGRELGDVLTVVASKVSIEIEFPKDVRPIRFIGRDGRLGANSAQLYLNQLYGGQEKYALIEVELPESSESKVLDVARARCSYQDMIANRPATSEGNTQITFSKHPEAVQKGLNIAVAKDVLYNNMAIAQDAAVVAADNRDYDQAAQILNINAQEMAVFAADNGLPDMEEFAIHNFQTAEDIKNTQSLPSPSRKALKTESLQTRSQQAEINSSFVEVNSANLNSLGFTWTQQSSATNRP
jgi:Ca-activated chloride channel family protein